MKLQSDKYRSGESALTSEEKKLLDECLKDNEELFKRLSKL